MQKRFEKTFTFEGKRYHVYGSTEREAIENMALKKRDLEEGRVTINSKTSVKDWSELCIETYKVGVTDTTLRNINNFCRKHILPYIGHMSVGSVKPVMCQQILNRLEGYSKSYIAKVHQHLCFIFAKAKENQMINVDPTLNLTRPDGHTRHRRAITETERTHLLKVCYADRRLLPFLIMLQCGCRPAEALQVRANDIQLIEGVAALHIRGTKSDNADRYVPIPPDLLEYINKEPVTGFDLLSTKMDGSAHTYASYQQLRKHLRRVMNISMGAKIYRNQLVPPLPLAPDFTPYCLRHTYCTDLKKAGVPLGIAKDYMGHADISTTANIYSHSDADTFLQGAKILGYSKNTTPNTTVKRRKMS